MFAKILLTLSLAASVQAVSLMPTALLSCSNGLFCATGETCMSNAQGAGAKLACSPLPNAVICNDMRHSCPSGSTCFNEVCMPADGGQPFKASMSKDAVSVGLRTYGQGIYIRPNDVPGLVNDTGNDICNMVAPALANFCQCHSNQYYASLMCQANVGNYIDTIIGVSFGLYSDGVQYVYGPGSNRSDASGTNQSGYQGSSLIKYGTFQGPTNKSFPIEGAGLTLFGRGISTTADFSVKYKNSVISLDVSIGVCEHYGTVPGLWSGIPNDVEPLTICSNQPEGQNLLGYANITVPISILSGSFDLKSFYQRSGRGLLTPFSVMLENSRVSAVGKATISFTTANVENFNSVIITLTGFTSAGTIVVSDFNGFGQEDSPIATATMTSGVLTVTFSSGTLIAGINVRFICSNIINPSVQQLPSYTIAAAIMTATEVLDTTANGYLPGINPGLSYFHVMMGSQRTSASTTASISFMPSSMASLDTVVVTLTGFTSTGNIVVGQFFSPAFSGQNPAATATLTSGVLTVTFSSGAPRPNAFVFFTCTNIINPSAGQAPLYNIAAATMSGATVLDETTSGFLPGITSANGFLMHFGITLDSSLVSATGKATITFTPTNVEGFNKVVITLTGFTSTSPIHVGGFSGPGFNYGQGAIFAVATLESGVLTVIFSSDSARSFVAAPMQFVCTNITNPSAAQASLTTVVAATMTTTTMLDITTSGVLPGINPS